MPQGVVTRSTGSRYYVRAEDGSIHECVAKGAMREMGFRSTNPVAVGDVVDYLEQNGDEPGSINSVADRRNYMVRRSVNLSHQIQVIAANVDQALLMVTIERPFTSTGFIDRFLVTAEAYEIPVVILFNKVDDLDEDELEVLEAFELIYGHIGYRTLRTSSEKEVGLEELARILKDKTSLLSGHSGAGKSTLINTIAPGLGLRTQEVSDYHSKGQHTTTFAEMFNLPFGGRIIDTPGIKGFGLVDMEKSDIADQFPEFVKYGAACKFSDCMHLREPGCKVLSLLEEGGIASSRYTNYLNMLDGNENDSPYRKDIYS